MKVLGYIFKLFMGGEWWLEKVIWRKGRSIIRFRFCVGYFGCSVVKGLLERKFGGI